LPRQESAAAQHSARLVMVTACQGFVLRFTASSPQKDRPTSIYPRQVRSPRPSVSQFVELVAFAGCADGDLGRIRPRDCDANHKRASTVRRRVALCSDARQSRRDRYNTSVVVAKIRRDGLTTPLVPVGGGEVIVGKRRTPRTGGVHRSRRACFTKSSFTHVTLGAGGPSVCISPLAVAPVKLQNRPIR